jgi:hypothetical protein
MDKSEARRIVEAHLSRLMDELGVRHWTIEVKYDLRDEDDDGRAVGQCDRLLDYDRATIRLDPDNIDEADLLHVLRHELFHVVLAPFDLFGTIAEELTGGNAKLDKAAARVWRHAVEKTISALERMHDNLKGDEHIMGRQKAVKADRTTVPEAKPKGGKASKGKPAPKGSRGKGDGK